MSSEPPPACPAVEDTCAHRRTAVELGNEWNRLSRRKARATRAADTAEADRLGGQLRAIEAAVREQYTGCDHGRNGDQHRGNKGVEPAIRDEADHRSAGDRADPNLSARMDAATTRADTALTRGQREAAAPQRRQCAQPTRARTPTNEPTEPTEQLDLTL